MCPYIGMICVGEKNFLRKNKQNKEIWIKKKLRWELLCVWIVLRHLRGIFFIKIEYEFNNFGKYLFRDSLMCVPFQKKNVEIGILKFLLNKKRILRRKKKHKNFTYFVTSIIISNENNVFSKFFTYTKHHFL